MLPDEELAEVMAETVQRTLEIDHRVTGEELEIIRQTFNHYLEQGVLVLEEQFQQEIK